MLFVSTGSSSSQHRKNGDMSRCPNIKTSGFAKQRARPLSGRVKGSPRSSKKSPRSPLSRLPISPRSPRFSKNSPRSPLSPKFLHSRGREKRPRKPFQRRRPLGQNRRAHRPLRQRSLHCQNPRNREHHLVGEQSHPHDFGELRKFEKRRLGISRNTL